MNVKITYEDDCARNMKKWEKALFATIECWCDPEESEKAIKRVQKKAADFKAKHPEAIGGECVKADAFNGQVIVTALFENPAHYELTETSTPVSKWLDVREALDTALELLEAMPAGPANSEVSGKVMEACFAVSKELKNYNF